ncbi:glycerol-3-phosphate 1-O-acyltransferase PlsY [Fodinibius sediminis]|uniref:Glycerol-3-phosphate acyltransferase n=1 Tax=Fodinibius sediminis TaxID=1214077 RepID=A0A521AJT4_9BACT|nr:glycerol-3-phosphate 1-O-acyltransferase PlsY [Fodinibius sediminis]SMO35095.1 acyl-phosphate glycerol-3-phosphate acyltransferase [Fodinibius sediminis]
MLALGVVILLSYLVGSIPSSIWVGRLVKGVDIRNHGSGNAGATNTFRLLGWRPGVSVLAIDFFKGFVSSLWISQLAYFIGTGPVSLFPFWDVDPFLRIVCGVVAVLGHMFPLYSGFDGGKGMATAAGMLCGIEPVSVAITFGVFLIVMLSSRYVSLASLVAAFIYPLMLVMLRYGFGWAIDGSILIFGAIVGLGIIVKHRGNIRRLLRGTENQVSSFRPAVGWLNKEEKQNRG